MQKIIIENLMAIWPQRPKRLKLFSQTENEFSALSASFSVSFTHEKHIRRVLLPDPRCSSRQNRRNWAFDSDSDLREAADFSPLQAHNGPF